MTDGRLNLVDTHAHVAMPAFDHDRTEMLSRACVAGVRRLVCPGVDVATSAAAVELAGKTSGVGAAVGFHPLDIPAEGVSTSDLAPIEALALNQRVVAVGEIGLDYSGGMESSGRQMAAFRDQINLASRLDLPVIVHNRESDTDILEALEAEDYDHVILHCFTGDDRLARGAIDHGWYIGIGGVATYKSGQVVARLLQWFRREQVLIETDSPYLSPVPFRGRRNEPAYVIHPLHVVARAFRVSIAEAAALTTANALSAFPRLTAIEPMRQE